MDPSEKPSTSSPATGWQEGSLEFEITDFGEARRVLDDESISQFHVETVVAPAHWKRLRRVTLATDRALSGQAIDWLLSLPPGLHPKKLSAQFPRIANALAQAWHEPSERQALLDKLFDDGRTGRKGFSREVQGELTALRDWMAALHDWDKPF
jgi:hypothetical protein